MWRVMERLRDGDATIEEIDTLHEVTENTEEVAILAAARLGSTRLIDNVRLSLNPVSDWGMLATN